MMKTAKSSLFLFLFLLSIVALAQNGTMPRATLEDMNGDRVLSTQVLNTEGPTVISFWATWCKPCIAELNELTDLYADWQDETNVKIIAISIDDTRTSTKVPAFINSRGWEFDIYLDKNSDLKRALNINNIPYSLLLNKEGAIVWQHTGYVPGDEEVLYERLLELGE